MLAIAIACWGEGMNVPRRSTELHRSICCIDSVIDCVRSIGEAGSTSRLDGFESKRSDSMSTPNSTVKRSRAILRSSQTEAAAESQDLEEEDEVTTGAGATRRSIMTRSNRSS